MPSLIATLRALVPPRPLTPGEALRVAELQAVRLLQAQEVKFPPVPESAIAELPRVQIERLSPIPVSGSAHWTKGRWQITLNGGEPTVRQRYTMAHETKHVLDHPFSSFLYPDLPNASSAERAEQVANFFAACLLIPRMWLKRDWGHGIQRLPDLAARYEVSQVAMHVRLMQIGLVEAQRRCGPSVYARARWVAA